MRFTVRLNYTWSKSLDDLPLAWGAQGPMASQSWTYPWYFQNADLRTGGHLSSTIDNVLWAPTFGSFHLSLTLTPSCDIRSGTGRSRDFSSCKAVRP